MTGIVSIVATAWVAVVTNTTTWNNGEGCKTCHDIRERSWPLMHECDNKDDYKPVTLRRETTTVLKEYFTFIRIYDTSETNLHTGSQVVMERRKIQEIPIRSTSRWFVPRRNWKGIHPDDMHKHRWVEISADDLFGDDESDIWRINKPSRRSILPPIRSRLRALPLQPYRRPKGRLR